MKKVIYYLLILGLIGTAQANLVPNGDFSAGQAYWNFGGAWVESAEHAEYPNMMCARFENGGGGEQDVRSELITVVENATIHYSFGSGIWQETTVDIHPVLEIQFYDADLSIIDSEMITIDSYPDDWWGLATENSGEVTTPAGTVYLDLVFSVGIHNNWQGGARVGNVVLAGEFAWNPVPEDGAQNVGLSSDDETVTVELSWNTGMDMQDPTQVNDAVDEHYLYLDDGTGWVLAATISASGDGGEYTLEGLSFDGEYRWRVDHGLEGQAGDIVGPVWSFSTVSSLGIVEQPDTVVAFTGEDVSFTVIAEGPDVQYQWYKSHDSLVDPVGDTPLGSEAELKLSNVGLADEAYYYCEISSGEIVQYTDVVTLGIARKLAHWTLDADDYEFGEYVDISGEGINALVQGTPTFVDGIVTGDYDPDNMLPEGALKNVQNHGHANVGDFNPAEFSDQFTISLWFKWTRHSEEDVMWNAMIAKRDGWTGTHDNMFVILVDGPAESVVMQSWGETRWISTGAQTVDTNEWYHLAAVYESGTARLHLNGTQMAEAVYTMQGGEDSTFYIGRIGEHTGERFDGILDDIQVFNYALEPEAIADLYQHETGEDVCLYAMPGDLTGDCAVHEEDLAILLGEWLQQGMYPLED